MNGSIDHIVAAIGLRQVVVEEGPVDLCAVLDTPRGRVRLDSGGL